MNLLVTGGKGFIGRSLVEYLVNKGHNVSVIDIDKNNKEISEVLYYYNDITMPIYNEEDIFKNIDAIFHLAAEIYVQKSLKLPDLFKKVNEAGTKNILDYAVKYNIKKVVFSSTSAIYGNDLNGSSKEYDPVDCLNAYSLSKYNAELICKEYSEKYNMDISCLRYFNVYGEGQHESGPYAPAIGKFIKQKRNNESLTIVGNGGQKRDFVNVIDVAKANYQALINNSRFNVYNVGSGSNISILKLAKLISNNIVFIPQRDGECKETLADINKSKVMLSWEPKIKLKDWIDKNR
jgi:nucleoside-diphosphate-sugar epimerase